MTEPMSTGGFLQISVRSAGGALPVPDVSVTVSDGAPESSGGILYSTKTGRDGLTPVFPLPAPPRSLSMTPGDPAPYGVYNITVSKEGYETVENIGVPIFDGILSTQPVLLVPLSEFETDRPERIVETPQDGNPLL